ncbi:MAG: hypothetical protein FJX74_14275, partial [Armatimonadetes bacterium]|nr:hypothetical protein [Armatimonadota bacterium]
PIKAASGRVYVVYTYNTPNLAEWEGKRVRADTHGDIVLKYSDDHGRTWSAERYRLPNRPMAIDRANFFGGRPRICWCVGKPILAGSRVYFGGSKVGHPAVAPGPTEGIFFTSPNLLTEPDPARIRWRLLPEGDVGLKAPQGHIAEEQNLVQLSDGGLYCVYRTVDGFLCSAYSRDGGRSWTGPEYARYSPGGRFIKNPRGPAFIRKFSNGKYLLIYYNHGGRDFTGRNPYWLSGGVERDGFIHWSEPEIALYDDEPNTRIGYPDFIEQDGRFWITETNKSVARIHEIDPALIHGLWNQPRNDRVAREGLLLHVERPTGETELPALPNPAAGGGFTLDFDLEPGEGPGERTILDARNTAGPGLRVRLLETGALRLELADGATADAAESDPGLLTPDRRHHVSVIVDGGPKVVTWVVDGVLCDGGAARPQGWQRFSRALGEVCPGGPAGIPREASDRLRHLRVYGRYLRTSEAVGNWRAGR